MTDVPFSFPIEATALSSKGRDYGITAKPQEREAVARALGLESLDGLNAQLAVVPGAGGAVNVTGRFTADVVQACVVTLAPVRAHIAEAITRTFVPAPASPKHKEAASPTSKESDAPKRKDPKRKNEEKPAETQGWVDPREDIMDPLVDGVIDLGEVVIEQLALALDPYPRAPGATFAGSDASDAGQESPFAALTTLKLGKAAPRRGRGKSTGAANRRPAKGKTGG